MNADEWALENAAQLVAHVERHGLTMTWSEAQDQLRRCTRFLEIPAYVDDGEAVWCLSPPLFQHGGGRTSRTRWRPAMSSGSAGTLLPGEPRVVGNGDRDAWGLAGELVMRLSALLTARMRAAATAPEIQSLIDLSVLVVNLSSRVSQEMTWIEEDGERCVTTDDEAYLLMRARDLWQAATLLREARGSSPTCDAGPVPGVDEAVGSHLAEERAADAFLWDLDWWITERVEQDPPPRGSSTDVADANRAADHWSW